MAQGFPNYILTSQPGETDFQRVRHGFRFIQTKWLQDREKCPLQRGPSSQHESTSIAVTEWRRPIFLADLSGFVRHKFELSCAALISFWRSKIINKFCWYVRYQNHMAACRGLWKKEGKVGMRQLQNMRKRLFIEISHREASEASKHQLSGFSRTEMKVSFSLYETSLNWRHLCDLWNQAPCGSQDLVRNPIWFQW